MGTTKASSQTNHPKFEQLDSSRIELEPSE
jgi:hypothetical protein